jgi:hypothetical protein
MSVLNVKKMTENYQPLIKNAIKTHTVSIKLY